MASKAPTPDRSALEKIAEWAKAEHGVTVTDDGTIVVDGTPPLTIEVTADEDRSQLIHARTEAGAGPDRLTAIKGMLPRRGSPLVGTAASGADGVTVTLVSTLYHDGLTRQGFVQAFNDLVGLADQIATSIPAGAAAAAAAAAAPAAAAPSVAAAAPAETVAPVSDTAPTMAMPAAWVPTHKVPAGGMKAWPKPDPALTPIAELQARVELSIAERKGDWARVVGSNGWTGWVDARRLQDLAAPTATPAARTGAASGAAALPLGLIGAVILGVAAFLPWFDIQGFSVNSLDVALPFLWDVNASGEPALGYLILALAALGLAAMFLPQVPSGLRRLAGLGGFAVAAVFAYQVYRGFGVPFGDVIDAYGFGVYGAAVGGALLAGSPTASATRS